MNCLRKRFLLPMCTFAIYSICTFFIKEASKHSFLSFQYVFWVAGEVLTLGVYAALWQKVLSYMPLHRAYLFKSISLVFSFIICYFIYCEPIGVYDWIGTVFIVGGLFVLTL